MANLDLTLEHVQNLTIVSDRMKGLTNAVKDVIPTAKHCFCCRHISQNIQAKFKNDGIVMKFWCAARSTRV
ncbi:transposase, partial [Acinetobacter baumannii]